MNGYARSMSPYTSGLRPKAYLGERVELLKRNQMLRTVKYVKLRTEKKLIKAKRKARQLDPFNKEFMIILPWVLTLTFGIILLTR